MAWPFTKLEETQVLRLILLKSNIRLNFQLYYMWYVGRVLNQSVRDQSWAYTFFCLKSEIKYFKADIDSNMFYINTISYHIPFAHLK